MKIMKIMKKIFEFICCLIAGSVTALILILYALNERGYFAFGGEWFVIIGAMIVTYFFIYEKKNNKNSNRKSNKSKWFGIGCR